MEMQSARFSFEMFQEEVRSGEVISDKGTWSGRRFYFPSGKGFSPLMDEGEKKEQGALGC